jgi:hypothetical protein
MSVLQGPRPAAREPQFEAVQPDVLGVSGGQPNCWADFNNDGYLDLAITNNNPAGKNAVYRNLLAANQAHNSLQVIVLDSKGHFTRAGSEVRLYVAGTRKVLGGHPHDQSTVPTEVGRRAGLE